jgi:hypothetical protein
MVDYCKIFCSKLLNCCVTILTGILCTGQRWFFILCLLVHTKEWRIKISVSRAAIHALGPVSILIRDPKLFWKKVDPKCMLSLINFNWYSVLVVVVRINKSQYYKHNSGVLSSNIYLYQVTGYHILTEFICSFLQPPPKFLLTHHFSLSSGIHWISHLLSVYSAASTTNVLLHIK